MHVQIDYVVPDHAQGQRLDKVIAESQAETGRGEVAEAIKKGHICVNGVSVQKCAHKARSGDHITGTVCARISSAQEVLPQNIPLDIYYEDDAIVVLCKPRGLITHPGAGHAEGTLLNGILYRFPQTKYLPKGGLVQRLDKDTSGLMVVALTLASYTTLVQMMQNRRIKRVYEAMVWGRPPESAVIDAPLGRHKGDRRMRAVVINGRHALTYMQVLAYGVWGAVVECTLKTGRTHQIRVHMKHLMYPICGDTMYGFQHPPLAAPSGWRGQVLHAKHLAFHHPITEIPLQYTAPFPEGWGDWLGILGIHQGSS